MNPLASGDPRTRLALSLLLIVAVHIVLFFNGNESATPAKLLMSFVLSSTAITVSHLLRTRLMTRLATRRVEQAQKGSTP